MIFLTVGTSFSFDRLVKAVDTAVGKQLIKEDVFAQIGPSKMQPKNMEYRDELDRESFGQMVRKSTALISHAGIGSITMALKYDKPLLVMPRMKKYKEHVNDHQVATAKKFEELGHVLVAYEAEELPEAIERLRNFVPLKRQACPQAVADRISQFINNMQSEM